MNTQATERYLESFGKQVVNRAKGNLQRRKKGGGNLEKSIRFEVKETTEGYSVQFFMADYGTFVDKGVSGAGGKIKSGKHKGSYSGRRSYKDYESKIKTSPFKFGSGKSSGSIYKGIGSFIRKKGLQPRSEGGQYMTTVGLKIAIVKVLWTKGIEGISFFQKPLGLGLKQFGKDFLGSIKEDIINNITTVK